MKCLGCLKDIERWHKPVRAVGGQCFHNQRCYVQWLIRKSHIDKKKTDNVIVRGLDYLFGGRNER